LEWRGPSGPEDTAMLRIMKDDIVGLEGLELKGEDTPWWRLPRKERPEEPSVMEGIERVMA